MKNPIVVLLTPFQLTQLERVSSQCGWDLKDAFFLTNEFVSRTSIKEKLDLVDVRHYDITRHEVSFSNLMKKPFSEIAKHRKMVQMLRGYLKQISDQLRHSSHLIIGSDKDIFTQLLFHWLRKNNPSCRVVAIDEGSGYYKQDQLKDRLMTVAYRVVTPILFGMRYQYIGKLAQHQAIDEVYARYVDMIPSKSAKFDYHQILAKKVESNIFNPSQDLLLFTSPLSEDHHCDLEKERDILDQLFAFFQEKSMRVSVKPHPREKEGKYENYLGEKVHLIDGAIPAEDLNVMDFIRIMHFGSSIILDLDQRGYPLERVITLDMEYSTNRLTQMLFQKGTVFPLFSDNLQEKLNGISNGFNHL